MREKTGKWLLRKILYQYIPNDLIERPKMVFGIIGGATELSPI